MRPKTIRAVMVNDCSIYRMKTRRIIRFIKHQRSIHHPLPTNDSGQILNSSGALHCLIKPEGIGAEIDRVWFIPDKKNGAFFLRNGMHDRNLLEIHTMIYDEYMDHWVSYISGWICGIWGKYLIDTVGFIPERLYRIEWTEREAGRCTE